jgi:hypothetical protein
MAGQQPHAARRRRAGAQVRAAAAAGSIVREVLSSSERTKLNPTSDRGFYSLPRLVRRRAAGRAQEGKMGAGSR